MGFLKKAVGVVTGSLVGDVSNLVSSTVGKLITDKDLANKLDHQLQSQLLTQLPDLITAGMDQQRDILLAELQGESWLQRNWRPILMISIVAIVVNNYILFPYLSMFTDKVVVLQMPIQLWDLMKIGVGGYIVGRSGEKIVKTMKNGNDKG